MTVPPSSLSDVPPWLHAVSAYDVFDVDAVRVSPLGDGLINETFLVEAQDPAAQTQRAVLQRVSPIFGRAVHEDIEAITAHLAQKGHVTPRLLRTPGGELSVVLSGPHVAPADVGSVWRLLDFIPGHCYPRMTPTLAAPAGRLVGRFHAAVADLQHSFHFTRPGAHVLSQHVDKLKHAIADAQRADFVPPESPIPAAFFPLADALLRHADTIELTDAHVATLPRRICHGDLKISNLRFDDAGHGLCLLDLDTLGLLPLPLELGDALRSWCNTSPRGEDSAQAHLDMTLFEEALHGYADVAAGLLNPDERAALVAGLERIAFQLSVRFAVDVVRQNYFRFRVDPQRHPTRATHNLLRAQGQLSLVQAVTQARSTLESIVQRLFASSSATRNS